MIADCADAATRRQKDGATRWGHTPGVVRGFWDLCAVGDLDHDRRRCVHERRWGGRNDGRPALPDWVCDAIHWRHRDIRKHAAMVVAPLACRAH